MGLPENCLKSEKSENKLFQFSVWKNGEFFNVNIKKFRRENNGVISFTKFEQMNFSIDEFEYFKHWIKEKKKRK